MMKETMEQNGSGVDASQTATLLDDAIPAKFKDPETGAVRVDALARSYKALEQKLSGLPHPPRDPGAYNIRCEHGMFAPDDEVNQRLHEVGLSNDQLQVVYDLAAEKLVPMVREIMQEAQAEREVEKLINHFGGAEKWREVSRQLLAYGQRALPAEVLESLSSTFDGVLALHRMMRSEEPGLKPRREQLKASGMDEAELQSLMRDPKYWRDKDPAVVAKVTKGFQDRYGR